MYMFGSIQFSESFHFQDYHKQYVYLYEPDITKLEFLLYQFRFLLYSVSLYQVPNSKLQIFRSLNRHNTCKSYAYGPRQIWQLEPTNQLVNWLTTAGSGLESLVRQWGSVSEEQAYRIAYLPFFDGGSISSLTALTISRLSDFCPRIEFKTMCNERRMIHESWLRTRMGVCELLEVSSLHLVLSFRLRLRMNYLMDQGEMKIFHFWKYLDLGIFFCKQFLFKCCVNCCRIESFSKVLTGRLNPNWSESLRI